MKVFRNRRTSLVHAFTRDLFSLNWLKLCVDAYIHNWFNEIVYIFMNIHALIILCARSEVFINPAKPKLCLKS